MRSCAHKVPTVYTLRSKNDSQSGKNDKKIIQQLYPNHMHILTPWRKHLQMFKKISKQVAQRATIAHLSRMCQVNLPQNLMQPFPHPYDATHKIWSRLTNWLQRYSSSKVWNFCHSRASNFDDDSIKNEWASMETPLSHYKSIGNFLDLKSS